MLLAFACPNIATLAPSTTTSNGPFASSHPWNRRKLVDPSAPLWASRSNARRATPSAKSLRAKM